ncbi:MAG: hypothetical protein ACTSVW_04640 [Candidatus Njordarchaeales archaeon]
MFIRDIFSGLKIIMKFIADFHVHSKYSRATSRDMDIENLDKWASLKGIKVMGTGDFTHPEWLKILKDKLEPAEPGLFKYGSTYFVLTSEISCIYSKAGRTRKIHIVILAPSFEIVDKINTQLSWIGNLKSDGRPILGLDAKELVRIVLDSSEDCLVVPAHCLLPNTYLHNNSGIKMIKDISVGDYVYTHKGRLRKVEKIYVRPYQGKIYNIIPYYFRMGLKTTPEHPFYIIKTRWCPNMSHTICKKNCMYIRQKRCSHKFFKNYHPQWIQAKDVKKGDILIFPRFNREIKDIKEDRLDKYLDQNDYKLERNLIKINGTHSHFLPNIVKVDKSFCRLMGYYISEGYTDNRDSISFCFGEQERKYLRDLKILMKEIFGLSSPRVYKRENTRSIEIIYFSKILAEIFSKLFYNNSTIRKANTKRLPAWVLNLPPEKQAEVFKGWWRGDAGYTSSRILMNQMKMICLRLGIIPSIGVQTKENFNAHRHKLRRERRSIKANHNLFHFYNLSFFENNFGLLEEPCFRKFNTKLRRRHGWIDERYAYIPVDNIETEEYKGKVYNLEIEKDNSYVSEFATVHNCWTPWFSLFGANSGFDAIEECFEDLAPNIFALETGLSSDPPMNWRLSKLDDYTLVSNSDAHSPSHIGREANVFDTELDYFKIAQAIKSKDPSKFLFTIEFFPQEGKYHFDGHRNCNVLFSPKQTRQSNYVCPNCGRPLTIGVMHRVEKLADRDEGFIPPNKIPYKHLIPLQEIIGEALEMGVQSKAVQAEYQKLVNEFGNEFKILLDVSREDLDRVALPRVAEGVTRVREGQVKITPGYDGVYGKINIFGEEEKKEEGQKSLF